MLYSTRPLHSKSFIMNFEFSKKHLLDSSIRKGTMMAFQSAVVLGKRIWRHIQTTSLIESGITLFTT